MACPNPADHARVRSLELLIAALKAELRACERRESDLSAKLALMMPPEPVSQYTLLRDAYKAGPVTAKDEELRLVRGFSDSDLEYSQKLRVAKGKGRPLSIKLLKEADRVKKFKFCKLQRDFTRDLMKLRAALPDGKIKVDNVLEKYLNHTDNLLKQAAVSTDSSPFLLRKAACWTCKAPYNLSSQLCHKCAQLNLEKRLAFANLHGRVAVVTGGRVRIGFHVTVSLLRMGATVVATTRFPVDCILQLSSVSDFNTWKDRLFVYGLDMRSPLAVERFTSDLAARFPYIHILINNAAQTIAKPPSFYAHLMEVELRGHDALPPALRPLMMHDNRTLVQIAPSSPVIVSSPDAAVLSVAPAETLTALMGNEIEPIEVKRTGNTSKPDAPLGEVLHPLGFSTSVSATDNHESNSSVAIKWAEGDQLDLRSTNSWIKNLEQISTTELVEVQAVNVIAPFILIRNLQPLLEQAPGQKYIVNVSAMEGQFYRWKPSHHPHTNMGKAALNMLTRTLGCAMAVHDINLTSVDTGWVTDEMPLPRQALRGTPFIPPLGTEDGAARILDPIIMGESGERLPPGTFYKDFKPTYW